jgi:hypothetical protein
MLNQSSKLVQSILEGINSDSTKDTLSMLSNLVEVLETKEDPELEEVKLVEDVHNFIEKLKLLEARLRNYVKESNKTLPGNKLASLYEKLSYNNGSIYHD